MGERIAVVGAGIVGRLAAFQLEKQGYEVSLFDKDDWVNLDQCSHAAAGMIAPYCELETAEFLIARIGYEAFQIWPEIMKELSPDLFFCNKGSLVVAHQNDMGELTDLKERIADHPLRSEMEDLNEQGIGKVEPELEGRFTRGLYYPLEAAIDNREVLAALEKKLEDSSVQCHMNTLVTDIKPNEITVKGEVCKFDCVIDCRGLAARDDLNLRGVRGEALIVEAKDVGLTRPIRLLHPRYPVYIVPHGGDKYFIGATAIESEDDGPITVRTTLELLSAAYSVHPGFAEARVVETVTNLRPAYLDNIPKIRYTDGLIQVNGLYRHGFLMSPRLVQGLCNFLKTKEIDAQFGETFEKIES